MANSAIIKGAQDGYGNNLGIFLSLIPKRSPLHKMYSVYSFAVQTSCYRTSYAFLWLTKHDVGVCVPALVSRIISHAILCVYFL